MSTYIPATPAGARRYEHMSATQALSIVIACATIIGFGLTLLPF